MQQRRKTGRGHVLVVFGLFLALFGSLMQGTYTQKIVAFGTEPIATLSNQYRVDASLPTLTTNALLTQSAQAKADDMAAKSYFAHNSPNGDTPWVFFGNVGYSYESAGENLALTNESPSSVVDGWYNSPTHRANLLNSTFTEVGYGVAFVPSFTYQGQTYNDVWLVAAHYALPVASQAVVQPTTIGQPATPATASATTTNVPPTTTMKDPAPVSEQPTTAAPQTTPTTTQPVQPTNLVPEKKTYTTNSPLAVIQPENSHVSNQMVTITIVLGVALVTVGIITELRRLLHHQRLLPKFHP